MHTTQLIATQRERTSAAMADKLSTMTSVDAASVWITTDSAASQEDNRTQEEINRLLEVMNRAMFIKLLPMVVFLVVLIVVGVFGNLLVFLVYLKQFKACATRVFVLTMAVCDFLTNVFAFPWLIQDMRYMYSSQKHFCISKGFLGTFPVIMSFLILVVVALDRRHRICQPLKRQLSSRKAACLMILPLILTSVIVFPFSILYGVRPLETSVSGVTGSTCEYPNTAFGKKVKGALGIVLAIFFVVGFALLVICYAQILHRIYQQNKRFFVRGRRNANGDIRVMKTPLNKCKGSSQEEAATEASVTETFLSNENATEVSEVACEGEDFCAGDAQRAMNRNERPPDTEDYSARCDPQTVSAFFKREVSLPGNAEDEHGVNCRSRADIGCSPDANEKGQLSSPKPAGSAMPENSSEASSSWTCKNVQRLGVQSTSTKTASDNLDAAEAAILCAQGKGQSHEEEVARSGLNPRHAKQGHQKGVLLSRTTFMMFVLTIATLVCYLPYIALMIAKVEFANVHLNSQKTNLYFIARSFPIVNSIINPFVYSFCNSKFRLQCRRFLTKVRKVCCPQM